MIDNDESGTEHAVLACILLDPKLIHRIDAPPEAFRRPRFRDVYEVMLALAEEGTLPDGIVVAGRLGDKTGEPREAYRRIEELTEGWAHTSAFPHYVKDLQGRGFRNRLVEIETETKRDAPNFLLTPDAIEEERARKVREARLAYGVEDAGMGLGALVAETSRFYRRTDALVVSTGLRSLDARLGEVHPGSVMTVLARPGIGKSNLGLNLMANWLSLGGDWGTAFISLEMPASLVGSRLIRMVEGLTRSEVRDRMRSGEPPRQLLACEDRFYATFSGGMTLQAIEDELDRGERKLGMPIKGVVIDYLQRIKGTAKESPYEKASRLAVGIKDLAIRRDCFVFLLSQVGRGEHGGGGFDCPSVEGARDSGAIEEAADYVLGLWNPALKPNMGEDARKAVQGQLALRVLKGRNGGMGKDIPLRFDEETLQIQEA